MTVSAAPPTFPSPLSRKGRASMAGTYIFFFFFLSLSFPSLIRQPVTADYGTSASDAAPVTRSLGFGWRMAPPGQAFYAHRWRAAPANLGTDRVLLIVEKKRRLLRLGADPGPIRAIISAPEVPPLLIKAARARQPRARYCLGRSARSSVQIYWADCDASY